MYDDTVARDAVAIKKKFEGFGVKVALITPDPLAEKVVTTIYTPQPTGVGAIILPPQPRMLYYKDPANIELAVELADHLTGDGIGGPLRYSTIPDAFYLNLIVPEIDPTGWNW